ncbi:metal ABC transporter solute-binding protein, Zn/Mn family [Oceanobacillus saliphilus]|uniref:metal ABC transporter solute-binding protein, Zn/Mn family n=1 Tax=Oceanobacillus saliphilus TaxID=2925834 RepID=UPI00201DC531|nr:zinc ABC transporter substrate-binding protein [Oceanobacillus saliphilus]
MKNLKTMILVLFFSIIIAGCSSANDVSSHQGEDQLEIYTSIYPIQYAVERIGGDTVSAKTVYPPGVDAHTYEPTTKDMTTIADSTAFIYMGAGMEGFAESAAAALASQDVTLIEIGVHDELYHTGTRTEDGHDEHSTHSEDEDGHTEDEHAHDNHSDHSDEEHDESEEADSHDGHNHGDQDPHIWIDPLRMIAMAEIIKNELVIVNPEEEALYNENFAALEAELHELDENYQDVLGTKKDKHILVSHAAFGYWEDRYGIEQIAINGLSSSNEPSQRELTEIIDQAREYDLDYIIFEQNSSNRVSEVIQGEIGVDSLTIHNLSVLTEEDINNDEDYISLMNYNLEILDIATK